MAEPTMEEVVNVEEELQPCDVCGRTFLPRPLEKHMRVCQRNASKKRKIFNSQKQRVGGTELASFHQPVYIKKSITSESPNKSNKWKEKHIELVNAIRAARNVNVPVEMSSSGSTLNNPTAATSGGDRCPSCDRQFGPRAFDRHVEWCKERNTRVQKSPADVLLAKERLAARTKYKVPLPTKSKRSIIKDKYSPTLGNRADSFGSTNSNSCTNLERASSTIKTKHGHKKSEVAVYDHGDVMGTMIVEEKVTKKTEKEKSARERKALPEIKPAVDLKSGSQSDYNPFLTAERQLLELLECDDFKPFFTKNSSTKPTQRPHTVNVAKTNHNKHAHNKILKSAENVRKKLNYDSDSIKRTSVIDPPCDFQDADDFEIIESLINQNCLDSHGELCISNETSNNIFNESVKNLLTLSNDCENNLINKNNKYNDDLSAIDPRLINENDNLAIPKNLIVDSSSSSSSNDQVQPLANAIHKLKTDTVNTTDRLAQSSDGLNFINSQKTIKPIIRNTRLNLKKQPKQATSKSTLSLNSSFISCKNSSDKKKLANPIRRCVSIRESPNKPNLKSKQDVEHYFIRQEKKPNKSKVDELKHPEGLEEADDPKVEELFSVDYEMYEEYKKYEELYLKEKQLQHKNSEIPLSELTEYDDIEFLSGCNTSKSNTDSAYNSLNRSNPKIRSKINKLNPLEYQKPNITPEGSQSSSSSEAGAVTKIKKRIPKFCHECGSKYPIETAKYCVECGAKRLTL